MTIDRVAKALERIAVAQEKMLALAEESRKENKSFKVPGIVQSSKKEK